MGTVEHEPGVAGVVEIEQRPSVGRDMTAFASRCSNPVGKLTGMDVAVAAGARFFESGKGKLRKNLRVLLAVAGDAFEPVVFPLQGVSGHGVIEGDREPA